jgi:succinyl-CoA synthetase beta subunit
VKIHEFQAKGVLAQFGVPVPRSGVASTPAEAHEIATKLGGRVVVKSQIHAGGRGKGTIQDKGTRKPILRPAGDKPLGGVVVVDGADAARDVAGRMLGNVLVTHQSGPEGRVVGRVLIEEGMQIEREFYLALLLDRATHSLVFIASAEGGTEIEEVAAERPDAILKAAVDPRVGFSPWMGRKIGEFLGLPTALWSAVTQVAHSLHEAFLRTDASLAEINPLILTGDGRIVALDAKMSFDDNALYRQPMIKELRDLAEEDPLEIEASKFGLNYIKLDGTVGCMVNGAGLAMGTMDIIQHEGASPANFLDVGGGAKADAVAAAFRILLADKNVKAILINIFGGIMRCDIVAEGVVTAAKTVGLGVPLVVRLEGTNVDKGKQILRDSGLPIVVADGMHDAAVKVVAAAAGR